MAVFRSSTILANNTLPINEGVMHSGLGFNLRWSFMQKILTIRRFKGNKLSCWTCEKEYTAIEDLSSSLGCSCGKPIYLTGKHNNGDEYVVKLKYAKDIDKEEDDDIYIMGDKPQAYEVNSVNNKKGKVYIRLSEHGTEVYSPLDIIACVS